VVAFSVGCTFSEPFKKGLANRRPPERETFLIDGLRVLTVKGCVIACSLFLETTDFSPLEDVIFINNPYENKNNH